jgi:uncharacterized membrane protein YkoI
MRRLKQTCAAVCSPTRFFRSGTFRIGPLSIGVLGIACGAALAVEPDTMFPSLEACMEASLQKQEGIVLRWELTSNRDPFGYEIDVLAPNDYRWTMRCTEGTVGAPVRKVGNKDYKKFVTRIKVPEKSARFTAIGAFPHVAEVNKMQLELSGFKGVPYYTYELATSDGRVASVEVNAATAEIDRTKSERK